MNENTEIPIPTPAAQEPMQKRIIDMRNVNFEVDPMVAHKIQTQMNDNPRFAQTINTNITKLFYEYLMYKVKMRENLNIAIKGETRSGKSTVAISLGNFIASMTRVPYGPFNICANESEYYTKVRKAKFNELYHIDEQKESKFGAGSFREEMGIMDMDFIINQKKTTRNPEMKQAIPDSLEHYSQAMLDLEHENIRAGQILISFHIKDPIRACSNRFIQRACG